MSRALWLGWLGALTLGCAHERNLTTPGQRIVDDTAYTLQKHELRVDFGLGGVETDDLGAEVSVHGGVTDRLELSTNAVHWALGVVNARGELAAVEHEQGALSFELGVAWTRPEMIWVIPPRYRRELRHVDMLIVPARVNGSWLVHPRVGLHLGVGYIHADVEGKGEYEEVFADGRLGTRDLFFEPQITADLGKGVALILRAHLSAWAASYQAIEAEYEVRPGVVAGGTLHGWRQVPLYSTHRVQTGVDWRAGDHLYLRLLATGGDFFPDQPFIVVPTLELYWRFGGKETS